MTPLITKSTASTTSASPLAAEYASHQTLFDLQPAATQRFLDMQARTIAQTLTENLEPIQFALPTLVIAEPDGGILTLPADERQQGTGSLFGSVIHGSSRSGMRTRLLELEGADDPAIAAGARLLRWAIAHHMIYDMLPAGRTVFYEAADGDVIPSIPAAQSDAESALTEATDAIAEQGADADTQRGELLVPYVPYARRFYLPQWVAFDAEDQLITNAVEEAQSYISSMQRYLEILHAAVSLAPYMVEDPEYQRRRRSMLGQLVNQGRALARYQTREIIEVIRKRAARSDLNRGLSLTLPYFDDQDLTLRSHNFQVIPAGRIMFVPGFMVRAVQEEQVKVAQDTRLSLSTRKHLLADLSLLEQAFQPANH